MLKPFSLHDFFIVVPMYRSYCFALVFTCFYVYFIFLLVTKSPSEESLFFSLLAFDVFHWSDSFL